MNVLVVNAGSSSLKYQLFDTTTDTVIAKGVCERIGIDGRLKHSRLVPTAVDYVQDIAMPDHTVATKCVVDALLSTEHGCVSSMEEIEAVGHRVVHGGAFFSQSMLLTDDVLSKLEQCYDFSSRNRYRRTGILRAWDILLPFVQTNLCMVPCGSSPLGKSSFGFCQSFLRLL